MQLAYERETDQEVGNGESWDACVAREAAEIKEQEKQGAAAAESAQTGLEDVAEAEARERPQSAPDGGAEQESQADRDDDQEQRHDADKQVMAEIMVAPDSIIIGRRIEVLGRAAAASWACSGAGRWCAASNWTACS